jgi:hypothetical protein
MKATYQPIDRDKARFDFLSPRNQLLVKELWKFGDTHGASVEISVFPTISIRVVVFHPPKKPAKEFKIELDGDESPADLLEDVFRYLEIPFDLTSHGTYYGLNWNTALEWVTDEKGENGFWAEPRTEHCERFTKQMSLDRWTWVGFDGTPTDECRR